MRISRIKGIQCLLGETCVTKNCPAAPVIHGTLHLGVGGGQSVGILCRRSIRRTPRVRLCFWTWLWSLASGGLIGNLSGYSPATHVVHGTFHPGIGGGQFIRILCRRSARRTPRIRSRLRIRPWRLACGCAIGSLSEYSPASALFPEKKACALICL